MLRSFAVLAIIVLSVVLLHSQDEKQAAADLFRQRNFAGAAERLERHLIRYPDDVASRLLLGLSYQLSDDLVRAEAAFREAVRRRSDHGGARYSLARVLYLRGRLADAEAEVGLALRHGEAPARVHTLIGLIEVERRQFDRALEAFHAGMKAASGTMVEPFVQAGVLLLKLNRPEEAARVLDEALARDPKSDVARRQRQRAVEAMKIVGPPKGEPGERIVLEDVGIGFVLENSRTPAKHLIETMPGGVAVFDYDNDGLPDVYFTNGAAIPSLTKSHARYHNRLYRNLDNFQFEDVTGRAGVAGRGYSMGVAAGDFDNDGYVDLFVAGVRSNSLYRNRGDGRFEDVTASAGIGGNEWSVAGAWFDFDRDGLLDLFVVNYLDWTLGKEPYCGDEAKGFRVYCHPKHFGGTPNRLYRNLGAGKFADVSKRSGIAAHVGKGMSAAIGDADGDGWLDVFVTNDAIPNFLFRNRADGTFEEIAVAAGVAMTEDGKAVSAMGADFRDYNNDGLPDIVFTALAGETFPLFRNEGKGRFQDVTYPARLGIASAGWSGWSAALLDLNNDGWKDLYTANSHVTDNIEAFSHDQYEQANTVFLNNEGSFGSGVPFGAKRAHRGAAFGDLDGDGRLDIVVSALGKPAEVWRNATAGSARWLAVQLEGRRSNRDGIGANVKIGKQGNVMTSAVGYASSSHGPVHFGLGQDAQNVDVEVQWPSGCLQVVKDVETNQRLRVVEPAAAECGR